MAYKVRQLTENAICRSPSSCCMMFCIGAAEYSR